MLINRLRWRSPFDILEHNIFFFDCLGLVVVFDCIVCIIDIWLEPNDAVNLRWFVLLLFITLNLVDEVILVSIHGVVKLFLCHLSHVFISLRLWLTSYLWHFTGDGIWSLHRLKTLHRLSELTELRTLQVVAHFSINRTFVFEHSGILTWQNIVLEHGMKRLLFCSWHSSTSDIVMNHWLVLIIYLNWETLILWRVIPERRHHIKTIIAVVSQLLIVHHRKIILILVGYSLVAPAVDQVVMHYGSLFSRSLHTAARPVDKLRLFD